MRWLSFDAFQQAAGCTRLWGNLCFVRCDLDWRNVTYLDGSFTACFTRRVSGRCIPPITAVDVNDLLLLVDRPILIAPAATKLEVGLVDLPPMTDWGTVRPCLSCLLI
jgi:hypothetical protein